MAKHYIVEGNKVIANVSKLNEKELMFAPYLMNEKNDVFYNKWNEYYQKIKTVDNKKSEVKIIEEVLNEN